MRARHVVSILSLVVIAGANYLYWKKYAADKPPIQVHSRGGNAARGAADPSIAPMRGILIREIVRQAWLIAQRDGLGLPTRDAALREPPLANALPDLAVSPRLKAGTDLTAVPARGSAFKWTYSIRDADYHDDYDQLAAAAESLSRGRFVDALKPLAGKGAATKPNDALPADLDAAERELALMNFTSQFAALRLAHQSASESGMSPAAAGILVRGYGNLSLLTQGLWNSTSQVMAARSILYAQWMVATAPKGDANATRRALWHRAYARAMAGLHGGAGEDLTAASALKGDPAPGWVEWVDAYARYQTSRLADLTAAAPGVRAQLPAFLAYLTIEHTASPSAMNQFGRAVLQAEPDNVRVIDAVSRISGVSVNHELTTAGLTATSAVACERVPKLPGVPRAVAAAAERAAHTRQFSPAACAAVATALVDAGATDRGEPSWAVLGRMLQDANFRNVERRIFFETHMWRVDATASYASLYPLIADHPYAPFVSLMTAAGAPNEERLAIVKDMVVVDPQLKMADMLWEIQQAGSVSPEDGGAHPWLQWSRAYTDWTTTSAEEIYRQPHRQFKDEAVGMLANCFPRHPAVIADKVETDWSVAEAEATALADAGGSPLIAAALGKKYTAMKDWPKAERYLRKYLDVCQDLWAYKLLAENYLKQHDEARWLATMQEMLKQPDTGLDHAQANVAIARHYMAEGAYEKAEPFADEAAASYAGWAMEVAAQCQEKLGHWDVAEDWIKREQERYGPKTLWLDWCKRTGHGDIDAARRAAG